MPLHCLILGQIRGCSSNELPQVTNPSTEWGKVLREGMGIRCASLPPVGVPRLSSPIMQGGIHDPGNTRNCSHPGRQPGDGLFHPAEQYRPSNFSDSDRRSHRFRESGPAFRHPATKARPLTSMSRSLLPE